jgi:hypothetical protein
MASSKQREAARRNIQKAAKSARVKKNHSASEPDDPYRIGQAGRKDGKAGAKKAQLND